MEAVDPADDLGSLLRSDVQRGLAPITSVAWTVATFDWRFVTLETGHTYQR
jgi:hypothetical protein